MLQTWYMDVFPTNGALATQFDLIPHHWGKGCLLKLNNHFFLNHENFINCIINHNLQSKAAQSNRSRPSQTNLIKFVSINLVLTRTSDVPFMSFEYVSVAIDHGQNVNCTVAKHFRSSTIPPSGLKTMP